MLEEIPGLLADRDPQFGDQGGRFVARQAHPRAVGSDQGHGLPAARTQTVQGLHVDDALLARQQRFQPGVGVAGEIQALQARVQAQVKAAERLDAAPDHPEQLGAVLDGQAGSELRRLLPIAVPQQTHPLLALKIPLEIGLQVEHVLGGQRIDRLGLRRRSQLVHPLGQLRLRQHVLLAVIAVGVIGVAENLDQIGLGQQPHLHRRFGRRARRRLHGEARDQPGGFAAAFRVDVADEIDFLAGEIGQQRRGALAGQRRNQIRLTRLAGPEHAGAHRPPHRLFQTAALGGKAAEFLDQSSFFLGDPLGIVIEPAQEFGTDLLQIAAGLAEGGVSGGHRGFAGHEWRLLAMDGAFNRLL